MIGEVFGNYRVIAKIGEGGMGTVYLAEHPSIGRKVAVKLIRPVFSNDAETLRRFVREARSTAQLRHSALVDIMDYGVHEKTGCAYIIMEYLEGESLDARLDRVGKLHPARAADIARQIALGMAAAHRAGIIHRDLKPGNVHLLVDPDRPGVDVVKVLDFGIAKLANNETGAGPTTRSDAVLGTPRYMAPEQCRGGGAIDHRADIYALGCLLYETLCGRPPFVYQWPGELIAAHLGEAPMPARAIEPAIPPPLEAIVMRALAKSPDHRQSTMGDVARELEQFLGMNVTPVPPADISVPAIAVGPSTPPVARPPSASPPMAPLPVAVPPPRPPVPATTTASVVMRRKRGAAGRRRRTLIAGGAVAATAGLTLLAVVRSTNAPHDEPTTALVTNRSSGEAVAIEPTQPSVTQAATQPAEDPAAAGATASGAPGSGTPPADKETTSEPREVAADPVAPVKASENRDESAPPANEPSEDSPAANKGAEAKTAAGSPAATKSETSAGGVRIRVANPRPGLRVFVDGRPTSLPVRLPRDQKSHALTFTAPNFKTETRTIIADQDHALTLEYRPKLYVP
jgi:serine/threonine-protein kinase